MTTEQNNKQRQPSQGLFELLLELKITISALKELYNKIDKKAREEGFSIDEIYEIANITDVPAKSSVVGAETTTTTTTPSNQTTATTPSNQTTATKTNTTNLTINNNNTKNEENKYFRRYFQHFQ
jgi:hypothetical protein